MKIAVVYDMLYPYNVGGVEIRNYEIAKRLVKKGHEVHLYGVKLWKGDDIIEKEGIYYHGVGRYKNMYNFRGQRNILEPISYSIKLYKELKKENFDIIDCSAFPYFPCFASKLAKKKAKFIITWHQYWGDYWFTYLGKFRGFFGYLIEKLTKRLTKYNIAVSNKTKKDLGLYGVKIISNGINLGDIKKVKPSKENSDLIYVGRLIYGKNVDILIKSISLLKRKPKVIIIGDGPDKEDLMRLTKDMGLENNVKFLGFIEKRKVYSYLKSSKVFVFPSILEGFGMAVIEAMACKLPVIVVNHKWNAAVGLVNNCETGFVVGNSEKSMAKAIDNLLRDEKLRGKLADEASKSIKKFSWDRSSEELIRFYREISL